MGSDDAEDPTVDTAGDPSTVAAPLPERALTLRIAWHPEVQRLGELAILSELEEERASIDVTRDEPAFAATGGGRVRRGIMTSYLSRERPAFTMARSSRGGVEIRPGARETRIKVDDELLKEPRLLLREALERGVVIVIGQRVVLVLRLASTAPASAEDLGLAGVSDAIARVRHQIVQVAPLDGKDVLIRGDTGTGKELVAHALHRASPRAARPFHAINMGRLSAATAASELFGHERGAFTGASDRHAGAFGAAEGGTLFLDEIGETPPGVQPMLLRALEAREIHPVGARQPRKVDVRVLLATDADLEGQVGEGRFDRALLTRLGHYTIKLPALRERREDIGILLAHFLAADFASAGQTPPPQLGEWLPGNIVAKTLMAPWSVGNVRQLRSFASDLFVRFRTQERVTFDAAIEEALAAPPPLSLAPAASLPTARPRPSRVDPELVARTYDQTGRSPGKVAKALGMSPKTVYRVLRENPTIGSVAADIPAHELLRVYSEVDGDLGRLAQHFRTTERALRQRLSTEGLIESGRGDDS